ncbi:MAG: ABC transporter ATP-binding protein [Gammaproteobacteria bacterium]|jgi:ABC-type polysaccharide/polyol phosphate transport system ATPase subunit|nr:ABC transporter ATP-binding protein [Gammaproteobacteria bacterium]
MSNTAISLYQVGKSYKRFQHPLWRAWDALGCPVSTKRYDIFMALQNIHLEINKGEKVALIGRNGAGKSTLLRLIAGQIKPSTGTIHVNGKLQALMELGTGFHPDFTGIENIRSSLAFQGIQGRRANKLIEDIIQFSELEDFITRPIRELSAGMYARLAFAVATTVIPDILIIDEILGAGDAYFIGKSIQRMKELTNQGATILFVSHDMSSTQLLCDRGIWLDKGVIQADTDIMSISKMYMTSVREDEEIRIRAKCQHFNQINQSKPVTPQNTKDLQELTSYERYGEGPIKITAFGFLDDQNNRRHTLISGDIAKACITYRTSDVVHDPVAVVAIYRPDGTCAMQVLSNREGLALKTLSGQGNIIVKFNPFLLGPGDYIVSVALFKELCLSSKFEPKAYDLHDRCYALKVLHPPGLGVEIGTINQPATWELA